jgi:hypothetical protein
LGKVPERGRDFAKLYLIHYFRDIIGHTPQGNAAEEAFQDGINLHILQGHL